MKKADVIIIGAGASGLFCAAQLGQAGKNVVVLDSGKKIGRKILMSGGGFCNFSNLDVTPQHYLSQNRHFVKSALARYTNWDFISLVAQYGIAYHEKELGQLFCDEGAEQIVQMLQSECDKGNDQIFGLISLTSSLNFKTFCNFFHGNDRLSKLNINLAFIAFTL